MASQPKKTAPRRAGENRLFDRILRTTLVVYGIACVVLIIAKVPESLNDDDAALEEIVVRTIITPRERKAPPAPTTVSKVAPETPAMEEPEPEAATEPEAVADDPGPATPDPQAEPIPPTQVVEAAPPPPRDVRKFGALGAMRGPGDRKNAPVLGGARTRRLAAIRSSKVTESGVGPGSMEVGAMGTSGGLKDLVAKVGSGPVGSGAGLGDVQSSGIEAGSGTLRAPGGGPVARTDGTIRQVVAQWAQNFQYCYERSLKRNPNLRGRVWLEFTIAPAGDIGALSVHSEEMDLEVGGLRTCLERFLKMMSFGEAESAVDCRYPLFLIPE